MNFTASSNGKVTDLVIVDYDRLSWDFSEVKKEIKKIKQAYNVTVLITQKIQSVKQLVERVKKGQKTNNVQKRRLE